MIDLAAIVEGETEKAFVETVLKPHLSARGVDIWATLPGRRGKKRGGRFPWEIVRRDILNTLRERSGRYCTTMFDYYALPGEWPGRVDAPLAPLAGRAAQVEAALSADLCDAAGESFDSRLFVPYIQLHEFEAILFASVDQIAAAAAPDDPSRSSHVAALQDVLTRAGSPEAIDDGSDTAPSKQIKRELQSYQKVQHGPLVAARIGLDAIRAACLHFNGWLTRLESLASAVNS